MQENYVNEQILRIVFDEGEVIITKDKVILKEVAALGKEAIEIYKETGSIIYANLYENDLYMNFLDDQSSMILSDCSVKMLLDQTLKFDTLTIKNNKFFISKGKKESKKIHLPTCGSECYDYDQATGLLIELSHQFAMSINKN
jgi:hypothetical protein